MDKKLLNSYLDAIGGLIIDENKIVTYKSLSRSLGVHVNTAKQLLHTYLSVQKNESSFPICATYLLAGKLKDGSLSVTIVNESDKRAEISKFIEITSDHVYSVQKGKSLKDIKVLCGIGKEEEEKKRQRVIECCKNIIKSSSKLKDDDHGLKDEKRDDFETRLKVNSEIAKDVKKTDNLLKNSNEKPSKSPEKPSPSNCKPKTEKKHANAQKQGSNIANFFANATQKNSVKLETSESQSKSSDSKKSKSTFLHSDKKEVETDKVDLKSEKTKNKENSIKKNERSKRKRIQLLSDSEDSDSSNALEEPPPLEEPEPEEPMKMLEENETIVEETKSQNKRKKRKIVDVTVMSDDGYLETRKEMTLATDSEDEVEKTVVPPTIGDSQKNKSKTESKNKESSASNVLKKQSSLLNFFKKK